ncbi:TPA: hypothetical protein PN979_003146 [Escherichia coli]|uniref:Uncharacterized protein n=1 Tax=Escherichia coli O8 TaxID=1010796 RepID=A0A9P2I543_ECOLX|nr:hypothetical protein [Escherichia coli]EFO2014030.1 hypothetical protein [Escherichia coli O8]EEV4189243.1 hypothetical protein [Escherichia coli]EEW1653551.1 hypothetical protein [Escherichia coli]EEX5835131.1 hypothetical protein [Escherichia coli]EFA3940459.1 hypothetical protein [Escherichia coli]
MRENDLNTLLRSVLLEGLTAHKLPVVAVKRSNQPTDQGPDSGPCLYFFVVTHHRYGSPQRTDEWDKENERMVHTESQWIETTYQITGSSTQNPADLESPTANDLIFHASAILQSDSAISQLRKNGVGVYRITDNRNTFFKNDRDQYEASPSFDITLTHKDITISTTPVASSVEFKIYRV